MTAGIEHLQLQANGITFHVAVSGPPAAPPLLCLHGFPEGWLLWRSTMLELGEFRVYAPDLRGYPGSSQPHDGYDALTLTDDIHELITALGLQKPHLLSHDWGGALGWIFAHRYSPQIRSLMVVNCTHPKTLTRAVLEFQDFQTLRSSYVLPLQIPVVPEAILSSPIGRRFMEIACHQLGGRTGRMDMPTLREMLARFQRPQDLRGPINYYRELVRTQFSGAWRARFDQVYSVPIGVPITLIWGKDDFVLSRQVAQQSYRDAGRPVDLRLLPGVGHFVPIEAPETLAAEVRRAIQNAGN
jgi:epoxide hydrolase 4